MGPYAFGSAGKTNPISLLVDGMQVYLLRAISMSHDPFNVPLIIGIFMTHIWSPE